MSSSGNLVSRLTPRSPVNELEAYLAGLVATDGCVHWRDHRPVNTRICLTEGDRDVLDHLGHVLGRPVYTVERRTLLRGRSRNNEAVLTLVSQPISWKTSIPEMDSQLERHYVRGLMDGDGCFTSRDDRGVRRWHFQFNSNVHESFLVEFMTGWLRGHQAKFVVAPDVANNTVKMDVWSEEKSRELAFLLYEECSFFIKRKRERALGF